MLASGKLRGYIDELSVTGLTSNPTIFDKAIGGGSAYDDSIRALREQGRSGEDLFFELALEDLREAADLFVAVHERTDGVDGWVSLEVSPLLADDTEADDRAGAAAAHRVEAQQHLHQDPRHDGRRRGDRGVDPRRHPDQRHAAVLDRALPRRRRGLHARDRAADRGRPRPRRAVGRLAVHQPLGQGGDRRGPRRAARQARHRGRQAHLPRLPRAARLRALAAARERGRAAAARCSGRAPGPRTPRPPTSSTSRRWRRR